MILALINSLKSYLNINFCLKYKTKLIVAGLIVFLSHGASAAIDMAQLESDLKTKGLVGSIHGSVLDSGLVVFTYRNPQNFFENVQLPLVSEKADIQSQLNQTKRHQIYKIQGSFIKNKAPLKHVLVETMTLLQDYESEVDHHSYQYKGDLNELAQQTELTARVHAISPDGQVLVLEYKDRVLPVFVKESATQELIKPLFRGDLIKLRYKVRSEPEKPLHLSPVLTSELTAPNKPVEVIESLVTQHGLPIEKTGILVKFPKSPQISFDVYAILVQDKNGTSIQYTLMNFDDQEAFKKIRQKVEDLWNKNPSTVQNDRNKLINPAVIIKARGTGNVVDPSQANPQILVSSPDDIELVVNSPATRTLKNPKKTIK